MPRLSGVGRAARYPGSSKAVDSNQIAQTQAGKRRGEALPSTEPAEEMEEVSGEAMAFSTFRPDREGVRKVLGDLEADVMEYIWSRGDNSQGINVREVFEALSQSRPIAYTTVMNTMSRLARKQLLNVRKEETAYFYSPNFTQLQFIETFIGRILDDLLVSFGPATRAQLEQRLTEEERERIARLKSEMAKIREAEEVD